MYFKQAKWIWVEQKSKPDTYGEFYNEFNWENGEVNCRLSCDGDYTLFINGALAWLQSLPRLVIHSYLLSACDEIIRKVLRGKFSKDF